MPILNDHRKTKEIALPSFFDSKVVIFCGLLFGDAMGVDQKNEEKYIMQVLPKFIKEWNFVDENQKTISINQESLKLFPIDDVAFLVDQIKTFMDAEKKSFEQKQ